jgi:CubicO group peptidase (beta-lactamase class C family)
MKNYFTLLVCACCFTHLCSVRAQSQDEKATQVESHLVTSFVVKGKPVPFYSIPERMKFHKIPGLSIAFIDGDQIQWIKYYGVKQNGSSEPVTEETIFQVGSVSKPVTAALVLTLAREGKVDLDTDVNKYLKDWQIPENKFTQNEKVTLRRLLSHSAGATVHGFNGYTNTETIPTLEQILKGETPAKNNPIVIDTVPGSIWRYSGGGYTVAQKVLEDVSGKSMHQYAQEKMFSKLNMKKSFFLQPLSKKENKSAATGHTVFGKAFESNFVQPELAAGGLWTSPSDLAKLFIELNKESKGKSDLLLDQPLATLMITPQMRNWALGLQVNGPMLLHPGSCEGFRAVLAYNKLKSQGVIMMTNGESGDNLMREILNSIRSVYQWELPGPRERDIASLSPEQYKKYCGKYQIGADLVLDIRYESENLKVYKDNELYAVLFPETESKFFILEDRHSYQFNMNTEGGVTSMMITGATPQPLIAERK